jgi:hypothetical protein
MQFAGLVLSAIERLVGDFDIALLGLKLGVDSRVLRLRVWGSSTGIWVANNSIGAR